MYMHIRLLTEKFGEFIYLETMKHKQTCNHGNRLAQTLKKIPITYFFLQKKLIIDKFSIPRNCGISSNAFYIMKMAHNIRDQRIQ